MTLSKKIPAIAAVIATMMIAGTAFADTHTYQATLTGASEVPSNSGQTTGSVTVTSNNTITSGYGANLQYTLNANGTEITMAHLHCAPAGTSGPVVVTLFMNPASNYQTSASTTSGTASTTTTGVSSSGVLSSGSISDTDIKSADCLTKIGTTINTVSDLINAINGGQIYANIHTVQFPDGAARGQLSMNSTTATSTPVIAPAPTPSTGNTNTDLIISLYQKLIPILTQMLQLLQQQKGMTH